MCSIDLVLQHTRMFLIIVELVRIGDYTSILLFTNNSSEKSVHHEYIRFYKIFFQVNIC